MSKKNVVLLWFVWILFYPIMIVSQVTEIMGNGIVAEKSYDVQSFKRIEIDGVFNVFLKQGSVESVKVRTDENLLDVVEVVKRYDKLIIGIKQGITVKKSTLLDLYITLKDITSLDFEGVGNVKTLSPLHLDVLSLKVNGIGNVFLNLDCRRLGASIESVGNVKLKGKATDVVIRHSGVGNLKAFDFIVQNLGIKVSGMGTVEVRAEHEIIIDASGVGNVYYKGAAKVERITRNGVGKVKHL